MSFSDFHFLRSGWLLALLPLAGLFYWLVTQKRRKGSWLELCDAELLPFLLINKPLVERRSQLLIAGLVSLLTVLALAGPTWQRLPSPAFRNDAALVIALDLAATMDATDIKPTRLIKARYKIADLLKQRKDGQTALLVYGGDAFTVTPLTADTATISSQLEALTSDIMPSPGNNMAIAVHKAADLLEQAGLTQGDILVVTDSVGASSFQQVEKSLKSYRLSILAVGSADGAPIPQQGGGFLKDGSGNMVVARLDANALQTYAQQGQGIYQTVTTADEDIENLQRFFNHEVSNPNAQESNEMLQQWEEMGPWLLLLVLPWAALQFRKGLLLWIGLCLLPFPKDSQAFDWQSLWQNANQRAAQAFKQENYQQAAEQFTNPAWRAAAQYKAGDYQQAVETLKNAQTAEDLYNRGTALAKAGKMQEALKDYEQALKLAPNHQDAQYNKELIEKFLQKKEEQKKQNQQSKDQDQAQDKQQNQQDQQSAGQDQQQQNQPHEQQKNADDTKDQQQQNGQQGEQKPPQDMKDPQQKQQAEQDKQQAEEKKAAEQAKQEQEAKEPKGQPQPSAAEVEKSETERANEQLLKRIPDEPTSLLKRKFKYQYSQRGNTQQTEPKW